MITINDDFYLLTMGKCEKENYFLEKDKGQQLFNGQDLSWNPGIPKRHLSSTHNLTDTLIDRKFW
jgi:hypothetical protein